MTDPATGAAYAAAGASSEASAAEDLDPAQWNVSDTSPEAEATRRMYAAGLTLSALNGEPLADELILRWIPAPRLWHAASSTPLV